MNKKLRMFFPAALTIVLLAGCQSKAPDATPSGASSSSAAPASTVSGSSAPASAVSGSSASVSAVSAGAAPAYAGPEEGFRAGTWQGESLYYFFNVDGSSGSTASMETGTGTGFTYEVDGDRVTFHIGSADDSTAAVLLQSGNSEIELKWEDGRTERLSYVSGQEADTFAFYSNDDLCDLAVSYYQGMNGGDGPVSATATVNPDGTVFIQVCEDQGDHLSSLAQYDNIDRLTASGTDALTDVPVYLAYFESDGSYRKAVDWFMGQTSEYEVVDGQVCGDCVVLLTVLRDPETDNYQFLQVFVLEQRGDDYEITAWRDSQYGAPAGFTAHVLATDELTVVFGDADTRPFTQARVVFDDGLFEIRPVSGYFPYVIAIEGKKNVADVVFDMEGIEVKYSEYFDEDLMADSASADIIPLN